MNQILRVSIILMVTTVVQATTPFRSFGEQHLAGEARVEVNAGGVPRLVLDGEDTAPLVLFLNTSIESSGPHLEPQVQLAMKAGVNIYSFPYVRWPWLREAHDENAYAFADALMDPFIEVNPHSRFILRLWSIPPNEYFEDGTVPDEHRILFTDGSRGRISAASDLAWELYKESLRLLIRHHRQSPHHDRIIAYHVGGQNTTEWFHEEYRAKGPDYSPVNQRKFRQWLAIKYQSDAVLAEAWNRPEVTLGNATIPRVGDGQFPIRGARNDDRVVVFYDPGHEQDWIDYSEYASDLIAERLLDVARMIKEETDGRKLVTFFYGYIFDLAGSISGHLRMGRLLRSPDIDMLASPLSYISQKDRLGGGPSGSMTAVDSVVLHGKMWMNEDDMRTHVINPKTDLPPWLSEEGFGDQTRSEWETVNCLDRNLSSALVHRNGTWWMDLIGAGAFNSPAAWNTLEARRGLFDAAAEQGTFNRPDLHVIVHEDSVLHVRDGWSTFVNTLPRLRNAVLATGVSTGFYYLQDFVEERTPPAKVYLFANAFALGADERAAIHDRLERENAVAVWQYAAGVRAGRQTGPELMSQLTGIATSLDEGFLGSQGIGPLEGLSWGWETRATVSPRVMITDPDAEVLGRYNDGQAVSAASKQVDGWTSILLADWDLSADLLRTIMMRKGVHMWTTPRSVARYDGSVLAVHAVQGGEHLIHAPKGHTIRPMEANGHPASDTLPWTFELGETRWFRVEPLEGGGK